MLALCLEPGMAEQIPGIGDLAAPLALAGGDRVTAMGAERAERTDAEREPKPVKTAMATTDWGW